MSTQATQYKDSNTYSEGLNTAMKIIVIALNTLREATRDKIFYNLLIFALLVIAASVLVGELSVGSKKKIIQDIGLASILLFGLLTAILVGIGLVSKEVERRTLYTILTKPVHRYEFLFGKYVGLSLTLLLNVIVMTGFLSIVIWWQRSLISFAVIKAILLIYCELALVTAIAVLFSTLTSPNLSGAFTLCVYIIGYLTADLKEIGSASKSAVSRFLIDLCYYVLPNFNNFNIRADAVHGVHISNVHLLNVVLYCIMYVAIVLCLSVISFQRKEFY
jgi:ABC-type transport system involved in multi-copper enzyme maturation permease subunit